MLSTNEIAHIINAKVYGIQNARIKYLLTDSRNFNSPDNVLFFAISGQFHNGHSYIPSLIKQGLQTYVVSETPNKDLINEATFLHVDDTVAALHKLSSWWRSQFKIPIIGITGSNGKTIVKEWIAQCIADDKRLTRSPGSYNSQIGVPLSVWTLSPDAELGLFEAGISRPDEMQKLEAIIKPTIGIFTNIGDAHQQNFKSLACKISEKLKLFTSTKTLIYQKHDNIASQIIEAQKRAEHLFSWSFSSNADVTARLLTPNMLEVKHVSKVFTIKLPFSDRASIENLMHTIATLIYLGYDAKFITSAVTQIRAVPMRLEQKAGCQNNTIINDSYNSDIGSLTNAMDFLAQQNQHPRKILILSDILQSGYSQEHLYQEVAQLVNSHKINFLIGIGINISKFKNLFITENLFFDNTEMALQALKKLPFENATILLKGSRPFHFETIDKILEAKTHRTIMEVNLNAIADNLNYFKSLIAESTGIIAMVKAFSYGSGSHEIANILQHSRVAYLAVAFTDEGVELRTRGIKTPIMVMNPDEEEFDNLLKHQLEPVVYDLQMLERIAAYVTSQSLRNFSVHLKLNTGMNRSGFNAEHIQSLAGLKHSQKLKVKTVFSHLAASDDLSHDSFTERQVALFSQMALQIEQTIGYKPQKHILNSAGIERFPQYQFDFVRLGIGLYGVSFDTGKTKQAARLKTRIAQVREVQPGETVGYNRKGEVQQPSRIATIPIGYADGYRRALSNGKGKVNIDGKLYPVIGNICMDMTMIDVTGTEFIEGDEVIIFGPELPITTLAKWLDTIPYEILTSVSARVKRIYIKE